MFKSFNNTKAINRFKKLGYFLLPERKKYSSDWNPHHNSKWKDSILLFLAKEDF